MSHYFIVCIGRSGSLWLQSILARATWHECRHEELDLRSKVIPQPWTPFPLHRWEGKESYGEVNGMLRYHLSAQCLGLEMSIDKRIYLRRQPRDIIASWMTQGRRDESELSATSHEVLWHARNLTDWAEASGTPIVEVERLWSDRAQVQMLVDWLGLDLQVTHEMMVARNTGNVAARQAWEWTDERVRVLHRAAERVGYKSTLLGRPSNPV